MHAFPIGFFADGNRRPWWTRKEPDFGEGSFWARRDGLEIHSNGYEFYCIHDKVTIESSVFETTMETVDKRFPILPAPVLTPGQVWLLEARNAYRLVLLDIPWFPDLNPGDPDADWVSLSGHRIRSADALDLLIHDKNPRYRAFLVSAPVHPRRAPWAPKAHLKRSW